MVKIPMVKIPVLRYSKDLPYTKILLWFRGGSSLESESELGFAHFAEHLIFKLRHNGLGIAEYIETLGGYSNAFTTHDCVVVEISVLNEFAVKAIAFLEKIIARDFNEIAIDEFEKEKAVVLEEMRMYEDDPSENLFLKIMENAFSGHPYGRKVIGEDHTLSAATPKDIERFFRGKMLFRPFLIVSGGFDGAINFSAVSEAREFQPKIKLWETSKRISIKHGLEKDYFISAWRLPPECGELDAMTRLIYTVTYGMDGGRLYNELVYENQTFDNFNVSTLGGKAGSVVLQTAAFSPVREKDRLKKWISAWENYDFTQSEIARAKEVILSNEYFNSEGLGDMPDRMGKSHILYGDEHKLERDYFYHVFHYGAADVNRFKKEFLSVDKAILGIAMPHKSRFTFQGMTISKKADDKPNDDFVRFKDKGVRGTTYNRGSSPFLSLFIMKKSGVLSELPGKSGGFKLFLDTLSTSAKGMDKDETEAYLDRFGITLSPITGNNTGGLRLTVRDSFVADAINILKKTIENPLKKEDYTQEKLFAASNLSLLHEDPDFLFRERVHSIIFKGTPYESVMTGTPASLDKVTFADIKELKNNFFSRGHWGVGISGCLGEDEKKDLTDFLKADTKPFTPLIKLKKDKLGDRIEKITLNGRKQLYIAKVFRAPGIYDKDFETMRMIEQFLMGQKSPYFQLLREDEGLVYSLDVWGMGGIDCGYISLAAISSYQKKEEVMKRIEQTVSILKQGLFDEKFLEEVKNSARFQHARSVVRNEFHAFNLAIEEALEMPHKNYLRFPQQLDKINKKEIIETSRRYLSDGLWLISEAGDE